MTWNCAKRGNGAQNPKTVQYLALLQHRTGVAHKLIHCSLYVLQSTAHRFDEGAVDDGGLVRELQSDVHPVDLVAGQRAVD